MLDSIVLKRRMRVGVLASIFFVIAGYDVNHDCVVLMPIATATAVAVNVVPLNEILLRITDCFSAIQSGEIGPLG